jgi:hypothetical protein
MKCVINAGNTLLVLISVLFVTNNSRGLDTRSCEQMHALECTHAPSSRFAICDDPQTPNKVDASGTPFLSNLPSAIPVAATATRQQITRFVTFRKPAQIQTIKSDALLV